MIPWKHYRYNPDHSIREIEREYGQSGDRRDWLRLQVALMRSGQPYERTFIESTEDNFDEYLLGYGAHSQQNINGTIFHGDKWLVTYLNNGWRVETWWDANYFDGGTVIGWTTLVYDSSEDQIGSAIHCGENDNCGSYCHRNQVAEIIGGSIEEYGGERPLEDTDPHLSNTKNYRRNSEQGPQPRGVPEHINFKGGRKTVCTSHVLAAFGIDSCTYHYSGQLKQRLAILRKNGWAARSRNSHLGRVNKKLKLPSGPKSVGNARKIISQINKGAPEENKWGDPPGTRYMIRVSGHALLLDYNGNTIVDTDPRARDRRKVLDIRAVFPNPNRD